MYKSCSSQNDVSCKFCNDKQLNKRNMPVIIFYQIALTSNVVGKRATCTGKEEPKYNVMYNAK